MARCPVTESPGGGERSCGNYSSYDEEGWSQTASGRLSSMQEVCQNFLPRPKITEKLRKHFVDASRFSLWARCVLWGQAGSGKRQLATRFAAEYGAKSGKKVLWVDDEGVEVFIRDYKQAYLTLTGKPVLESVPYGFPLHYLLSHIRRTLEERQDEWFLVVLDVNSAIESRNSNSAGLRLVDYLPTSGQTLITTSSVFQEIIPGSVGIERTWMGLKLATTLEISVNDLECDEIGRYYEQVCGGPASDIERIDVDTVLGSGFPRLTYSLSSMRHLQMNPRRYAKFVNSYFVEKEIPGIDTSYPRGLSRGITQTFHLIWRLVTNTNIVATRLLLYISFFGARHIPWNLLKQIREFEAIDEDELLAARNFLSSLEVFAVHTANDGTTEINMHHLVHSWIRNMIRDIHSNGVDYKYALYEMVDMMAQQFHGEHTLVQCNSFWSVIGHVTTLARLMTKNDLESPSCVALFSHVALFLFEAAAFVGGAESLINQAIGSAKFFQDFFRKHQFGGHCLASLHETRTKILLLLGRPKEAKSELKSAIEETKTFPTDEQQKQAVLQRLSDLEVEVAFAHDEYTAAITILELNLTRQSLTEYQRARQHHWMAKCQIASGSLRPALRHSHAALSYWEKQPNKWENPEMLRWVDWHVTILKHAGKFKAICAILPGLLDTYLSSIPPTSEEVWRAVCSLGQSQVRLKDHESLMVRALSAAKVEELAGHALTYCLMALRDFGCRLQIRGRLVEAEGIFRHNCEVAFHRKPPDLADNGLYDYSRDRFNLVRCLYDQGRRKDARIMRRLFKTEQGFIDNLTPMLRAHYEDNNAYIHAYRTALQLRQRGDDENLFNCSPSDMKRGLLLFGCLEDRLHEFGDPMFDVDDTGIGRARKSQVLHLLEYDLVYLAFFDRKGNTDDLCAPERQTILGQYFKLCECRRHRKRSGSLNPVELIEGHYLRKSCAGQSRNDKILRQSRVTRWLRKKSNDATNRYDGEFLSDRELEDLTKKAIKLPEFDEDCPEFGHCSSKFSDKGKISKKSRYCEKLTTKFRHQEITADGLQIFRTGTDTVNLDSATGELMWEPFFLQLGDHELDSEHIAVPNAADIPVIRITGADGAPAGPGLEIFNVKKGVQIRITSYFRTSKGDFDGYPISPGLEKIEEIEED